MSRKKQNISIRIRRDGGDGQLFSEIVRLDEGGVPLPHGAVVIDRVKGNQFNSKTVEFRAKQIATLLGVEPDINYEWPCIALKKLRCRCPRCINSGAA